MQHSCCCVRQRRLLTFSAVRLQVDVRELVQHTIASVFSVHGAVRMSSHSFGVMTSITDAPPGMAVLLAHTGHRVALRYEMRRPFARWLAQQAERAASSARLVC